MTTYQNQLKARSPFYPRDSISISLLVCALLSISLSLFKSSLWLDWRNRRFDPSANQLMCHHYPTRPWNDPSVLMTNPVIYLSLFWTASLVWVCLSSKVGCPWGDPVALVTATPCPFHVLSHLLYSLCRLYCCCLMLTTSACSLLHNTHLDTSIQANPWHSVVDHGKCRWLLIWLYEGYSVQISIWSHA